MSIYLPQSQGRGTKPHQMDQSGRHNVTPLGHINEPGDRDEAAMITRHWPVLGAIRLGMNRLTHRLAMAVFKSAVVTQWGNEINGLRIGERDGRPAIACKNSRVQRPVL